MNKVRCNVRILELFKTRRELRQGDLLNVALEGVTSDFSMQGMIFNKASKFICFANNMEERWIGHTVRMPDKSPTKMMFAAYPIRTRRRGARWAKWLDQAEHVLARIGMAGARVKRSCHGCSALAKNYETITFLLLSKCKRIKSLDSEPNNLFANLWKWPSGKDLIPRKCWSPKQRKFRTQR